MQTIFQINAGNCSLQWCMSLPVGMTSPSVVISCKTRQQWQRPSALYNIHWLVTPGAELAVRDQLWRQESCSIRAPRGMMHTEIPAECCHFGDGIQERVILCQDVHIDYIVKLFHGASLAVSCSVASGLTNISIFSVFLLPYPFSLSFPLSISNLSPRFLTFWLSTKPGGYDGSWPADASSDAMTSRVTLRSITSVVSQPRPWQRRWWKLLYLERISMESEWCDSTVTAQVYR